MINIDNLIAESMKAQDKVALSAYRMLKSRITEVKTQKDAPEYNDQTEVSLIQKMVKGLKETGELYLKNGREDLADGELSQARIIEALLPAAPTKEDVVKYLDEHYSSGIDKKNMGLVIKEVKTQLIGVDGAVVAALVKERLS